MKKSPYKADEDGLFDYATEMKEAYQKAYENSLEFKLNQLSDSLVAFGKTGNEQVKAVEQIVVDAFNDIIKKQWKK